MLRKLGHVTKEGVVTLKGRAACEISTGDELLTTELMFNGVFNSLDKHQLVALLSCLVPVEKSNVSHLLLLWHIAELPMCVPLPRPVSLHRSMQGMAPHACLTFACCHAHPSWHLHRHLNHKIGHHILDLGGFLWLT